MSQSPRHDLNIVVEHEQELTLGKLAAEIVDAAEVEPAIEAHHPAAVIPLGQGLVIGGGGGVGGVVLDDDDLEIVVEGLGIQTVQALFQVVGVVLVGDEDGHQGLGFRQVPHHMAGAGENPVLHLSLPPGGGQVIGHRLAGRRLHIGLGVGAPLVDAACTRQ